MTIPEHVRQALSTLERAGFEAYLVGGCVRDGLLGLSPGDWDICTSARPEETKAAFAGFRVVETGLRHGTVTVLAGGEGLEITTFRSDGAYSDGRHPDAVTFTPSLREDLLRRDFTCNALAWSEKTGLVDVCGGEQDIQKRILRCVGAPHKRLEEDALRILRALRFAARFDLRVEEETARALHACRERLVCVSVERIFSELSKLLSAPHAPRLLAEFPDVIGAALPELAGCSLPVEAMERTPPQARLRLALLLSPLGAAGAEAALERLHSDRSTREETGKLLRALSAPLPLAPGACRREIAALGAQTALQAAALRTALADTQEARQRAEEAAALCRACVQEGGCLSVKELAVDGAALAAAGVAPGPAMGRLLKTLLDEVLEGTLPNEKEALLARVRAQRKSE